MFTIEDVHPFHQLVISVALGLLVGLQRQWAESSLAGVRTFALISLLGTVCAILAERFGGWILVAGFSGVIAAMVVGNIFHEASKHHKDRLGLSTEIAMLLIFGVGALVRSGPIWLAAASTGFVVVVLQAKIELHEVASRFTGKELKAIMQFVLISLVIYPIIPNQTIDSLQVLNPREIWFMVVLIVGLGLAGYIAYKFYGENAGTLLSGVLGGVISSTATTASYSKASSRVSDSASLHSATIIVIAWTVVYIRLFIEAVIVAPNFRTLWAPLGSLFFISALSSLWLWRRGGRAKSKMPSQENPSEIRTALVFGAIYSAILFGVAYAKQHWGAQGLMAMAVLSGVTDMDAITLSTSRLVHAGKLSPYEGWPVIIAAATSNVFFKGLIASIWGGRRFFLQVVLAWGLSLLCGIGLLVFWRPV